MHNIQYMLDINHIIQTGGVLAVGLIIFAETGLLLGFFLPGDTLLIAAGVFAAQGHLPLPVLIPVAVLAAILGYQCGYLIGCRAGVRLFKNEEGLLRKENLERTEAFFKKHGRKTVLFARFIVVIRTIIPLVAGMGKMDKRKFLAYNIVGGVLWVTSVTLAAYWLGKRVPNLDSFIVGAVLLAILITSGTAVYGLIKNRSSRKEFMAAMREELRILFKR
jgi:membrane-associated protein